MSFLQNPIGDEQQRVWITVAEKLGVWPELYDEFTKEYIKKALLFIKARRKQVKIYPSGEDMFRCFKVTPYDNVKVVVLGQDPYNTEGTADGLAFSTQKDYKYVPSIRKIIDYLDVDMPENFPPKTTGDLTDWAEQGVFLMNTVLTVEEGVPYSHEKIGWKTFTKETVKLLNQKDHIVWWLLGAKAQQYESLLTNDKKLVIKAEHPAFAARQNRSWQGNNVFTLTNTYLTDNELKPIIWE